MIALLFVICVAGAGFILLLRHENGEMRGVVALLSDRLARSYDAVRARDDELLKVHIEHDALQRAHERLRARVGRRDTWTSRGQVIPLRGLRGPKEGA